MDLDLCTRDSPRRSGFINTSSIIISLSILAFLIAKEILIMPLITSVIRIKRSKDSPGKSSFLNLYNLTIIIRKFVSPDDNYII